MLDHPLFQHGAEWCYACAWANHDKWCILSREAHDAWLYPDRHLHSGAKNFKCIAAAKSSVAQIKRWHFSRTTSYR